MAKYWEVEKSDERGIGIGTIVDEYNVGPYKIFIFSSDGGEFKYVAEDVFTKAYGRKFIEQLSREVLDFPFSTVVHKLDEILSSLEDVAVRVVSKYFKLPNEEVARIAESVAFKCVKLDTIAPFLLDDRVEEVYFDGKNRCAYLDHRDWGRCVTDVVLSDKEVERILSRLRLESGFQLDEANPSLKTEIITRKFHVRTLAVVRPLAAEEFMIVFRRMRNEPYTIPELIFNGTITASAAAYLLFLILRRFNICVIGEPKTGKTTLINALDLLVPSGWRRVYIEDSIESLTLHDYGIHQVKVKVKPPEEGGGAEKAKEITQLLHRSPDWVYLGEIRSPEDSQAMFHALASGLVGLQTCHGKSIEDVVLRWVVHHNIPPSSLKSLDVLIETRRYLTVYGGNKRKIARIAETRDEPELFFDLETIFSKKAIVETFRLDPKRNELQPTENLMETPSVKKACKTYGLDEEEVLEEIKVYEAVFKKMAENRIFNIKDNITVINYLHRIVEREAWRTEKWEEIKKEILKYIERKI
ncbi:MAG: ATPase, T2SS/T4P/T4SS family [Candidatus Jordarchaeales archaeon]